MSTGPAAPIGERPGAHGAAPATADDVQASGASHDAVMGSEGTGAPGAGAEVGHRSSGRRTTAS